jgi:hypothetical protein
MPRDYLLYAVLAALAIALLWVRRVVKQGKRRRNRMERAMRTISASSTMMMSTGGKRSARQEMRAGESHIDVGGQLTRPSTTRPRK